MVGPSNLHWFLASMAIDNISVARLDVSLSHWGFRAYGTIVTTVSCETSSEAAAQRLKVDVPCAWIRRMRWNRLEATTGMYHDVLSSFIKRGKLGNPLEMVVPIVVVFWAEVKWKSVFICSNQSSKI